VSCCEVAIIVAQPFAQLLSQRRGWSESVQGVARCTLIADTLSLLRSSMLAHANRVLPNLLGHYDDTEERSRSSNLNADDVKLG
jgi:hypothetical protein